ncbi:MAG: protocatechuate 3,4-dioxygenase [Pseudomonadota bacterium]|nr:protocatechuate 3,4-dioxygenase [Pseudomonadota bacterium]
MSADPRRRRLLGAIGLLFANTRPALAGVLRETPRQSAGPFYPVDLPLDDDSDLVHVMGRAEPAAGKIADLTGRIVDRNGKALTGLRVEIWQCDANGRYRHPRENGDRPVDPGFQGFGHTVSDHRGRYRFRTIRPVPYPGRTPHIHVAVFPPGQAPFVTQLYVAGEPRNETDFLYQRVPDDQRRLVTAPFRPSGTAENTLTADWDIVLGVSPTT